MAEGGNYETDNYRTLLANVQGILDQSRIRLIGIEGRMNEGKSRLAEQLAKDLAKDLGGDVPLVHVDEYPPKGDPDLPYLQTRNLRELAQDLDYTGQDFPTRPTIIESFCVREVLAKIDRKLDLVIFVKKLNSGLWPPQFDQEKYENDPRRPKPPKVLYDDERRYLRAYRPHLIADLFFEWTEPRTVTD